MRSLYALYRLCLVEDGSAWLLPIEALLNEESSKQVSNKENQNDLVGMKYNIKSFNYSSSL